MAFDSSTVDVGWATKKSHFDQVLDNTVHIIESGLTFTGQKIFSTRPQLPGVDSETTASNGVSVQVGYDISGTISLKRIYKKIIEIGDWDMDVANSVNVAHGLTHAKIRGVISVLIRSDSGNSLLDLAAWDGGSSLIKIESGNVVLARTVSGLFDNAAYDSSSYNRGWIIIQYEE